MTRLLNYENLLKVVTDRLLGARIPGITAENILLPGVSSTLPDPLSIELSIGPGESSAVCETMTSHSIRVNIIPGTPLSGGEVARKMIFDLSARIADLFDPLVRDKRIMYDKLGNRICIDSTDQRGPDVDGIRFRVNVRLTARVEIRR